MSKFILGTLISIVLVLNSFGCRSYMVHPSAPDDVFQSYVQKDATKLKGSVRAGVGAYLVSIDNVVERKEKAQKIANVAVEVDKYLKTNVVDIKNLQEFVLRAIADSNLEDKAMYVLIFDGAFILVGEEIEISLPDNISDLRKLYATHQFATSALEGIFFATRVYGGATTQPSQ